MIRMVMVEAREEEVHYSRFNESLVREGEGKL